MIVNCIRYKSIYRLYRLWKLVGLCKRQRKTLTHPPQGSSRIRRRLDVDSWGVYLSGFVNLDPFHFLKWWILTLSYLGPDESWTNAVFIGVKRVDHKHRYWRKGFVISTKGQSIVVLLNINFKNWGTLQIGKGIWLKLPILDAWAEIFSTIEA